MANTQSIDVPKILIASLKQSVAKLSPAVSVDFEALKQFLIELFDPKKAAQSINSDEINAQLARLHALIPPEAARIDLVLGGATKIKEYVFESPRLSEVRGASALLDWINEKAVPALWDALSLPDGVKGCELIIYAGGGGLLAFAPFGQGQALADQIEQTYTKHTLTANSVAVAESFHILELRYGRLRLNEQNQIAYWYEDFERDLQSNDPRIKEQLEAYYYGKEGESGQERFLRRKTFGELVTLLANKQNRRRDQLHHLQGQSRWLPLYQLNPWHQVCQSSGNRPASLARQLNTGGRIHYLSEASARKQYVGELLKYDHSASKAEKSWFSDERNNAWSEEIKDLRASSWERQWEKALCNELRETAYAEVFRDLNAKEVRSASDVGEIAQASHPGHYIGLIYADGNNVGRLMATLKTPESYKTVSKILSETAKRAVFDALAHTLKPVQVYSDDLDESGDQRKQVWVHPFEILTIGGDDLLLIVPGSYALQIALEIGKRFEQGIADRFANSAPDDSVLGPIKRELGYAELCSPQAQRSKNRYQGESGYASYQHPLTIGLSAGVVVAQETTPIFFLRDLVEELLKSAKKKAAKHAEQGFMGGAVDFMILKAVSMVTDKIESFRYQALGDRSSEPGKPMRKLFAKPYSWHEFEGLIKTAQAFQENQFSRSQLYQINERLQADEGPGIVASVMDYLYTRSRSSPEISRMLQCSFEHVWRSSDKGTLALPPWLPFHDQQVDALQTQRWETIWPDLVEIYDMLPKSEQSSTHSVEGAV